MAERMPLRDKIVEIIFKQSLEIEKNEFDLLLFGKQTIEVYILKITLNRLLYSVPLKEE
jgi:hypothetical protein